MAVVVVTPASLARRSVARLIDLLIVGSLWYIAALGLFSVLPGMVAIFPLVCAGVLISYGYEVWLSPAGRSVGKRLLALRLVRLNAGPIDRALLTRRWLVLYALLFGFVPLSTLAAGLWPLFDRPRRQGLHDRVVATVVEHTARPSGPPEAVDRASAGRAAASRAAAGGAAAGRSGDPSIGGASALWSVRAGATGCIRRS